MKCSLGISNFLEEISSLSHSIVFLSFFALITEEGFLISPCYSLELCIQMGIAFLFPFVFHFSSFHSKSSSDDYFAFLHCFSMGMVLIPVTCTMSQTSVHSSSGTLSIRSSPVVLYIVPYNYTLEVRSSFKGLDLIDRVPDELWMEVHDIVQETGIKTIPKGKKCKKQNGCLRRPDK